MCSRRWGRRRRHELTETEWARLQPLLPPRKAGKRRKDDRLILNAIRWKLATGAPWRDLPERYGPWQTVYTRFRRGIRITIPRKRNERRSGPFDWALYRLRHRVENLLARCKPYRRRATRYEKCGTSYRARWLIAFIILWSQHVP